MAAPTKTTQSRRLKLLAAGLCVGLAMLGAAKWRTPIVSFGGCGPTSLYALCRQLGVKATSRHVFALFGGGGTVTSFAETQRPARQLGLQTEGYAMSVEQLRRLRPLGILHVHNDHFVALVGYHSDGVTISDPIDVGKVRVSKWSYAELASQWDGRILVVSRRKAPPERIALQ